MKNLVLVALAALLFCCSQQEQTKQVTLRSTHAAQAKATVAEAPAPTRPNPEEVETMRQERIPCDAFTKTLSEVKNLQRGALRRRLEQVKVEAHGCHFGRNYADESTELLVAAEYAENDGHAQLANRLKRFALEEIAKDVNENREYFEISGRRYEQYRRDMQRDFARGRTLDDMLVDYQPRFDRSTDRYLRPIYFE